MRHGQQIDRLGLRLRLGNRLWLRRWFGIRLWGRRWDRLWDTIEGWRS